MHRITREQPVVDFEIGSVGVKLTVYECLTWKEWDELVRAVGEAQLEMITEGYILPGDLVNGYIASREQCYKIIGPGLQVKRRRQPGYKQIRSGIIQETDLMYHREKGWVKPNEEDIGNTINQAVFGVLRHEAHT
jgi:hypothetical protein